MLLWVLFFVELEVVMVVMWEWVCIVDMMVLFDDWYVLWKVMFDFLCCDGMW